MANRSQFLICLRPIKKIHEIRGSLYGQSVSIFDLFKTNKKDPRGFLYVQSLICLRPIKKICENSWVSVGTIGLDF